MAAPRGLASAPYHLRRAGGLLLDALAPQACIYCDQFTGAPEAICAICLAEFEVNTRACPRCALPDTGGDLCPGCLARPGALDSVVAPLVYDPAVGFLLRRWKYDRQRYCARIAARVLLSAPIPVDPEDLVVATPLHWRRRLERGFNQSEDLLDALKAGLGAWPGAAAGGRSSVRLRRVRGTGKQALASRADRLHNLDGAFSVRGDVRGRSVILIDDVCTTGATGTAMAESLKAAGARAVTLWCLARTPRRA